MESKLRGVKTIVEVQDELCWISKKDWDLYHKWKKEQESKLPNWGKLIYGTK